MNFVRHISGHLKKWKENKDRKPLVIRGARQVGKTTLVNDFAKNYKNSIFLNLQTGEYLKNTMTWKL